MKTEITKSTETKHTPLPWHANYLEMGIHSIHSAAGCIAECQRGAMDNISIDEREANAAFIVRAVNAHDDLVAACKAAVGMNIFGDTNHNRVIRDKCNAALDKAKGQ